MKKNAIFALILAVSMSAAMTSCGPKEEASSPETPALQSSEGQYNEAVTEAEKEVVIEPTQEILDAELADHKVQLGNHVYQTPIPFQKLLDDGAVITSDVNPDSEIIEPNCGTGFSFIIDGKEYYSYATNISETKLQMKDCILYTIDNNNGIGIISDAIYAKGIRIGSTVDELKSLWGEPTENNIDKLIYEEKFQSEKTNSYYTNYYIEVTLDLETNKIKELYSQLKKENFPEDAVIVTQASE